MAMLNEIRSKLQNNYSNYLEYYNKQTKIKKTYASLYEDAAKTLSFLSKKGVRRGESVGILSSNKYEWVLIDLACLLGGFKLVAFHAKELGGNVEKDAKAWSISILIAETKYLAGSVQRSNILDIDKLLTDIQTNDSHVKNTDDVFDGNDIFTVVFTSGTTGVPKAIGLKVKAIEHTISTSAKLFDYRSDDKALVFLPLSVFTSRLYMYGALLLGFNVVVTVPEMVQNALRLLQPSIVQAVPEFFESICNLFYHRVYASPSKKFAYYAFKAFGQILPERINKKFHRKLYGEITDWFGGKIRFMITGTAPISVKTLNFYRSAGLNLYESYGLNETGVLALNSPQYSKIGSVGRFLPGYSGKFDINGQLLIKSDYCWSSGYLHPFDQEIHQQIYQKDGYIATGDIGWMDSDGFIYLKGRNTEVVTLSNGQKVHPSILERKLINSPLVRQAMVTGQNRSYLTAVIVRNCVEIHFDQVSAEIKKINKDFSDHQQIKNFLLVDEVFTINNKHLTANLKLNRQVIYNKYEKEIEKLY